MNYLDDIIEHLHVQSALYAHFNMHAPWGINFASHPAARFGIVQEGTCYLISPHAEQPIPLKAGDCFILTGENQFSLCDQLHSPRVDCDSAYSQLAQREIHHQGTGSRASLLAGRFLFEHGFSATALSILPPLLVMNLLPQQQQMFSQCLRWIAQENQDPGYASKQIIQKLVDVLLLQTLRLYCQQQQFQGGLRGFQDRYLAPVLSAIHSDLQHNWTLHDLAQKAGLSRAAFASHFRQVTGHTPYQYLTIWRMQQARKQLRSTQYSLSEIAAQCGYETDAAFQRVFKRHHNCSPGVYRKMQAAMAEANRQQTVATSASNLA